MSNKNKSFNFEEGTVQFWVREGNFDWADNKKTRFFEVSADEGKIFIEKNEENLLQASYKFKKEKPKKISVDISGLSQKEDHQVVFTWSREENKIVIYLDGEKIKEGNIK